METKDIIELLAGAGPSTRERKLEALLSAAAAAQAKPKLPPSDLIRLLHERLSSLAKHTRFRAGQIVRWKPGLKNRRLPDDGQPAIVVEVLDTPILAREEESGSAYFREPLDIVLGILDSDGDFVMFHYDSRRFEPWPDDKTS